MNIRNVLTIVILFAIMAGSQAQETKSNKKVVIIKKMDDNGKVTENRIEAEGKEAEALLKKMEAEEGMKIDESYKNGKKIIRIETSKSNKEIKSSDDKEGDKNIEITTEIINGKEKEHYKIIKKDANGEKVIEWNGDGEIPDELAKELGNININKEIDGDMMRITIDADDMNELDDMEEGAKIVYLDRKHDRGNRHKMMMEDREINRFKEEMHGSLDIRSERPNNNKVSLGVMIDDTDYGVLITDVVNGSAAESAGLRRGDIILKINDSYIFTSNGLLTSLNPYNPNEKVKVKYIRDGKEKSVSAILKIRE